jgi:hypothetical protein
MTGCGFRFKLKLKGRRSKKTMVDYSVLGWSKMLLTGHCLASSVCSCRLQRNTAESYPYLKIRLNSIIFYLSSSSLY